MNRPGKPRSFNMRSPDGRPTLGKDDSLMALARRILPQVEEGLVRLLLPSLAVAAILMFFTTIYRLVDDPLVAGVMAVIVPMIFLPLFRKEGIN